MNIRYKTTEDIELSTLPWGECFELNDEVYLYTERGAIKMEDGTARDIDGSTKVRPIKSTMFVDRINN